MKSVVIFQSIHKGNTKKIAEALAKKLGAKLVKPGEIELNNLKNKVVPEQQC